MPILDRYRVLDARSAAEARDGGPLFERAADRLEPMDADDFRLFINSVTLDGIRLSAVGTTGHRISPVDEANLAVLMPLRGVLATDDGRWSRSVREGEIAIPRPGRRNTMIPTRYLGLVVQIPLGRLMAANPLDEWRPDCDWPDAASEAAPLRRYLRYLVEELDAGDALAAQGRTKRSAAMMLSDLVLDLINGKPSDPPLEAGAIRVRLAEEVIRARLGEDLSVPALAAELGVGTRSLQLAFQRHRRAAPRQVIAALRLESARARLLAARPEDTVTGIALECGLHHFGRFAVAYRRRYGETPSETLARARRPR